MPGIKRLFVDIETSPNIVCSWRCGYKINISYENVLKERSIICIGYKWQDDKAARVIAWDKDQSDKALLGDFLNLLVQADEIVGHNLDRFDIPWIKTRCLFHKLPPFPHQLKTVDTLQWAKRYLYFNSNRLDYLAQYLEVGKKIKTEFALWKDILLDKNNTALEKMKRYCRHDVELLQRVWERLYPVSPIKTHVGVLGHNDKWSCPRCGGENVRKNQKRVTALGVVRRQMQCKSLKCGGYYQISSVAEIGYDEAMKEKKNQCS